MDYISPSVFLHVSVSGHSGYKDGECVATKPGGACAILGGGSLISVLRDNDSSSSFLTGVGI